jgi:hypothetical protein
LVALLTSDGDDPEGMAKLRGASPSCPAKKIADWSRAAVLGVTAKQSLTQNPKRI